MRQITRPSSTRPRRPSSPVSRRDESPDPRPQMRQITRPSSRDPRLATLVSTRPDPRLDPTPTPRPRPPPETNHPTSDPPGTPGPPTPVRPEGWGVPGVRACSPPAPWSLVMSLTLILRSLSRVDASGFSGANATAANACYRMRATASNKA